MRQYLLDRGNIVETSESGSKQISDCVEQQVVNDSNCYPLNGVTVKSMREQIISVVDMKKATIEGRKVIAFNALRGVYPINIICL